MVRAAALWGGFPQLELVDVNGTLPESVVHYLNEQVDLLAREKPGDPS